MDQNVIELPEQSWALVFLGACLLLLLGGFLVFVVRVGWALTHPKRTKPTSELLEGEAPAVPTDFWGFCARCWRLWRVRQEVTRLAAWAGNTLPQDLSPEKVEAVYEAEAVHRWLLSGATTPAALAADIKEVAGELPD